MEIKCVSSESIKFENKLNELGITFNQFNELRKMWNELILINQIEIKNMLKEAESYNYEHEKENNMLQKNSEYKNSSKIFCFRENEIAYSLDWNNDILTFQFWVCNDTGSFCEYIDSLPIKYHIVFNYYKSSDKWEVIIEDEREIHVWNDSSDIHIEDMDNYNTNNYITQEEIKEIKDFIKEMI